MKLALATAAALIAAPAYTLQGGEDERMSDNLDNLLGRLGAARTDRSLDDLEGAVVSSIRRRRAEATTANSLARCAPSVVFSVAVGIAAGGMAAGPPKAPAYR